MSDPHDTPDLVAAGKRGLTNALTLRYGIVPTAEPLNGGKSGASVYRLRVGDTTLIGKAAQPAECHFYEQVAPILARHGVALPRLEHVVHDPNSGWLVLEAIPHPLPRERWTGDDDVIRYLARLHSIDARHVPRTDGFVPVWDTALTEQALACFPPDAATTLTSLYTLQERSQPLFQPACLVSGDPNPTNWGLRDDGTLVLFDWERFTLATPAVDLAICVGGLGTVEQFRQVAVRYLHARQALGHPYAQTADALTISMLLAKLWTVVEYLSLYTTGKLEHDDTFTFLTRQFPSWLEALRPHVN